MGTEACDGIRPVRRSNCARSVRSRVRMEEKPRPLSFNYGFIGLPGRRVSEAKSRDCDSERGDEASTCFTDEWPTPGANADMSAGISAFVSAKGCPPDPILGMRDDFERDPANSKMNLAVGVYRTAEGSPLVLRAVQDAEAALLADQEAGLTFKEYLPSSGLASFCEASLKLLLGNTLDLAVSEKRVVATQALSGVGGLHLAARMIAKLMPHATVYLPSPSWPIHQVRAGRITRANAHPAYLPNILIGTHLLLPPAQQLGHLRDDRCSCRTLSLL